VRCLAEAATVVRGSPPPLVIRLPASDASRWRRAGVPAVCYGPQPTAVAGVDDFAREQDVVDCAAIYALAAALFGEFRDGP
jgi:succinyl-diaminopimelate desuccinylase